MVSHKIVLASGSPRRRQLMADLGYIFTVKTADVDESVRPGEPPERLAVRLAVSKAHAVAACMAVNSAPTLIVAADTVVALNGAVFGKPRDEADAECMLRTLRGQWHQVYSAICLLDSHSGMLSSKLHTTRVLMREYSDAEVRHYVESGDPLDKAGGYAIQSAEFAPVGAIEGCLTGVMGLPLVDLYTLLAEFGVFAACPLVDVCEHHIDFPCCQRIAAGDHCASDSIDTGRAG